MYSCVRVCSERVPTHVSACVCLCIDAWVHMQVFAHVIYVCVHTRVHVCHCTYEYLQ